MAFLKVFLKSIKKIFKNKKPRRKKKKRTQKKAVSKRTTARKKTVKKNKPTKKKTTKKKAIKKKTVKKKTVKKSPAKKKVTKKKNTPKKKVKVKKKKAAKKSPVKKKIVSKEDKKNLVGVITHYFSRIEVVVIKIVVGNIKIGDEILIKGKTSQLIQKVDSLQIESVDVKAAKKGQLAGLKVQKKVSVGDRVYKVLT
ncbi:hypothetical protein MNBD_BACTEROID05-986 [hydrothermal vent metagenome]|uniref:Translation elongation factor-like protein n=1 Tax=hydrothermal vent metagenome TaxID=652676 RepID=A0A3B0TWD2_9ZZZZ